MLVLNRKACKILWAQAFSGRVCTTGLASHIICTTNKKKEKRFSVIRNRARPNGMIAKNQWHRDTKISKMVKRGGRRATRVHTSSIYTHARTQYIPGMAAVMPTTERSSVAMSISVLANMDVRDGLALDWCGEGTSITIGGSGSRSGAGVGEG